MLIFKERLHAIRTMRGYRGQYHDHHLGGGVVKIE
jgi:hypothetical protein